MIVSIHTLTEAPLRQTTPAPQVRALLVQNDRQPQTLLTSPPGNGVFTALVDGQTVLAAQESNQGRKGPGYRTGTSDERSPEEQAPAEQAPKEQAKVVALKKRDGQVRRHEQAHKLAAGPYAGPATYDYQRGPDGRLYAVDGEVQIDVSAEASPEATIRKMQVIIRAASAPADPSSQDRAIAARAKQALNEAQQERNAEKAAESQGDGDENRSPLKAVIDQAIRAYGQSALSTRSFGDILYPQPNDLVA